MKRKLIDIGDLESPKYEYPKFKYEKNQEMYKSDKPQYCAAGSAVNKGDSK